MRIPTLFAALSVTLCAAFASAQIQPLPKPCGMLTPQEASAIVGQPVTADASNESSGICMFKDAVKHSTVLNLSGYLYPDAGSASDNFAQLASITTHPVEAISGVGDQAAYLFGASGDVSLLIRKQGKVLLIAIVHTAIPNGAAHKPALLQAGKTAASRL